MTIKVASFLVSLAALQAQNVITTLAGTDYVFQGDGKPATQAQLGRLWSVAIDNQGNVYTGDAENHLVYRIALDGTLSVVAGNGISGLTGDGAQATRASFGAPRYVATDLQGNLFIADALSNVIRMVDANGVVSRVAGLGSGGYSGDGGPALKASFFRITSLAVGPDGAVYVADTNRIRRIKDGQVDLVAGNAATTFSGDGGPATKAGMRAVSVAADNSGNLYIADISSGRIRKVTSDGLINTIAGGGTSTRDGPALQAALVNPTSVAVDAVGNIYVADSGLAVVRKIALDGTIRTIAGNGLAGFNGDSKAATSASLSTILGVGVDSLGAIYVSDGENLRIRKVGADQTMQTIAGVGQTRFGGDGGPAILATFGQITGMTLDPSGNVFVSDALNHRVRRVGSDGTIQTVAGNGVSGDGGDEGPALDSSLLDPEGLSAAPDGSVFIAERSAGAHRVRKLTPDGMIHATAGKPGTGNAQGFSLPVDARQIVVGDPVSVATGPSGDLYYLDRFYTRGIFHIQPNEQVSLPACIATPQCPAFQTDTVTINSASQYIFEDRLAVGPDSSIYVSTPAVGINRIEKDGTQTPVAGNGTLGLPSIPPDNVPAVGNVFGVPGAMTFDPDGNLVASDVSAIFRINKAGILNLIAGRLAPSGSAAGTFGDGLEARQARLLPSDLQFDSASNLYIADQLTQRIRVVLAKPPGFAATPPSLSFSGRSQGPLPSPQTIAVTGTVPSLAFQVSVTTSDGGNWLQPVATTGLLTPRALEVNVDPSGLAPGDYSGSIALNAALAAPSVITIPVSFHVDTALPPTRSLDRRNLSFPFPQRGQPRSQTIILSNIGGGVIDFKVTAQTVTGGSWLVASASPSRATPTAGAAITVTADPGNLLPQTYRGSVTIAVTNGDIITIPVTMTVSNLNQAILLSQTGLSFTTVNGGGVTPPRSFDVLNIGLGVADFAITTKTLAGGPDWLQVDRTFGSTAAGAAPPTVHVSVNATGLDPGVYYGQVRVDARGTANSPQVLTVFLNVLPAGTDPGAVVDPAELVFTSVAGGPSPGSQNFFVYNVSANAKSYRSTAAFDHAFPDLAVLPGTATLDPNQPTRVVVQPMDSTAAGVYAGAVSLQFDDGTVRTVKVRWIVAPATAPTANQTRLGRAAGGDTCVPTMLLPSMVSLSSSYVVTAGWPVPVEVSVKDDCGVAQSAGSVTVSFSTGDPPLSLTSLLDGRWAATWQLSGKAADSATVTVDAKNPDLGIRGASSVTLGVNKPEAPPVFNADSVLSTAGAPPFTPIAPGSLLTISGSSLAEITDRSDGLPLAFSLGNAQVLVGGLSAPLVSVSPQSIQLVVPNALSINTTQQILITRGASYSLPVAVDVAAAQPAILGAQDGTGAQIFVLRNGQSQMVTPTNPASPGDTLLIRCTGLGAVTPQPDDGTLPNVPSTTISSVTVNFSSLQVPAISAVTSGRVGVYEVRVRFPDQVPPSAAMPLVLTVAAQTSPQAVIPVQPAQ